MNKITKRETGLLGIIIVLGIIVLSLDHCGKDKVKLYEHLSDSITFYKNKLGEQVARNGVLESVNVNTFLEIQSKDNEIIHLQARVKEYKKQLKDGGNVTNFESGTNINNSSATKIRDTVYLATNGDTIKGSIYSSKFKDNWIDYEINAFRDSIKLNLKTKDNYSVIIGSERPKWFKKKVDFVDVISESPYTQVKSVKTYKVDDKRKPVRLSLGVQVGYGFSGLIPKPYIGVGLQYNLLNIK